MRVVSNPFTSLRGLLASYLKELHYHKTILILRFPVPRQETYTWHMWCSSGFLLHALGTRVLAWSVHIHSRCHLYSVSAWIRRLHYSQLGDCQEESTFGHQNLHNCSTHCLGSFIAGSPILTLPNPAAKALGAVGTFDSSDFPWRTPKRRYLIAYSKTAS